MRVLQLHSAYRTPSGEDRVVALEAAALRAVGHEVVQHVVPNPARLAPTLGLLAQSPYNVSAARAAVEHARAVSADVVHVHNTWFAQSPSVVLALSRAGLPVVATMHNYRAMCIRGTLFRDNHECTECLGGSVLPGVRHGCYENKGLSAVAGVTLSVHRALRTWTEHPDLLLVPSETMRSTFLAYGFDADSVVVKDHFTVDPGPRPRPASASRTVLFVGRLRQEKGIHVLMEAWRRWAPPDLELVVVGADADRRTRESGTPPGARFTGQLPPGEVAELMLTARALVFPSLWQEPFGLILIEAMAAGLPVAGFRAGDAERIMGTGGLLVAGESPADLGAALAQLRDDGLVDRLGAAGRARYLDSFDAAGHTAALEAAYDRAVAVRRGRYAAR